MNQINLNKQELISKAQAEAYEFGVESTYQLLMTALDKASQELEAGEAGDGTKPNWKVGFNTLVVKLEELNALEKSIVPIV